MATTAPTDVGSKTESQVGSIIALSMEETTFGVDEKKLVRKLDLHIVPLIMLLYTFSFLDRSVIMMIPPGKVTELTEILASTSAMLDCTTWRETSA